MSTPQNEHTTEAENAMLQSMMAKRPSTTGLTTFKFDSVDQLHDRRPNALISNYISPKCSLLLEQKNMILATILAMFTNQFPRFARGGPAYENKMLALVTQFQLAYKSGILCCDSLGNMYPETLDASHQFITIVNYFDGNTSLFDELANKIHAALDAAKWCTKTCQALEPGVFAEYLDSQKRLLHVARTQQGAQVDSP